MVRILQLILFFFSSQMVCWALLRLLPSSASLQFSASVVAFSDVMLLALLWWCRLFPVRHNDLSVQGNDARETSHCWPLIVICSVVGLLCTSFLSSGLIQWLGGVQGDIPSLTHVLMQCPIGLFVITVLAPITEEVFFRGAVQRYLLVRGWHPIQAILFSSLLFGVMHASLWQGVGACLCGLFLGWVYWRSGKLWLTIVSHCVNNLLSVGLACHAGLMQTSYSILFACGVMLLCGVMVIHYFTRPRM